MNQELARVERSIGSTIMEFYYDRLDRNREFHAEDLYSFVNSRRGPTAPSSATRILQHKKKNGELNYIVVSRKNSLYRFEELNENPKSVISTSSDTAVGQGQ